MTTNHVKSTGFTTVKFQLIFNKFRIFEDGPAPGGQSGSFGGYGRRTKQTPLALILAPTRELATQIFDEARKFAYRSKVTIKIKKKRKHEYVGKAQKSSFLMVVPLRHGWG